MKVKIKPGAKHGYSGLIPNDDTVYEVLGDCYGGVAINPKYADGSYHLEKVAQEDRGFFFGLGFFFEHLEIVEE